MIVVRVELWSAITGQKTELARMEICNDGSSAARLRNYDVRTLRGRSSVDLNKRTTQRESRVEKHDAPGLHVWNLVAKALTTMRYGPAADAVAQERERIARAIEHEADTRPCAEDAVVLRSTAVLVRADFSYEDAEKLKIAAEAITETRKGQP